MVATIDVHNKDEAKIYFNYKHFNARKSLRNLNVVDVAN